MAGAEIKETMSRWLWLSPLLGLGLAVAVFMLWGLTLLTAVFAALLLVCPALIAWGVITLDHDRGKMK